MEDEKAQARKSETAKEQAQSQEQALSNAKSGGAKTGAVGAHEDENAHPSGAGLKAHGDKLANAAAAAAGRRDKLDR